MRIILAVTSIVFLFACKGKKESAESNSTNETQSEVQQEDPRLMDSIWVTYERTPCFGTCPVFKFTMYRDGSAKYEGRNFTDLMGEYQGNYAANSIEKIFQQAEKIGYFQMESTYDNIMVTDLPACYTDIIGKDGKRKLVNNRYKGPAELQELYKILDEVILSIEWKRIENNK